MGDREGHSTDRRRSDRDSHRDRHSRNPRDRTPERRRDRSGERDHRDGERRHRSRSTSRDRRSHRHYEDRHRNDRGHHRDDRERYREREHREYDRNRDRDYGSSKHREPSPERLESGGLNVEIHPLLATSIDAIGLSTGAVPLIPKASVSTSLANQRAALKLQPKPVVTRKKRDADDPVSAFLNIKPEEPLKGSSNPYFDRRIAAVSTGTKHVTRPLHFHQKGKFMAAANQMRKEAQMEVLRREIAEGTLESGMDVEIVGDLLAVAPAQVPKVEWWDMALLPGGAYDPNAINLSLFNNLIQRPALLAPPADLNVLVAPKPLALTPPEQKKLRRQRRLQEQKDKQEQIRLGLLPPEEPRVKLSSLNTLLASESVQDPTLVEAEVRAKIAARQEAHMAANEARKQAAAAVPKAAPEIGPLVHVAVYQIDRVDHPQWKYKMKMNAQQDYLTGCAVLSPKTNIIVVEGLPKHLKHYKALLTRRINWEQPPPPKDGQDLGSEPMTGGPNACRLLWEGTVAKASWSRFEMKEVKGEVDVKEYFLKLGLEHYWNLTRS